MSSSTTRSDRAPRNAPDTAGPEAGLGSADTHAGKPQLQGDRMGNTSGWMIFALVALLVSAIAVAISGTSLSEVMDPEPTRGQQALDKPAP